MNLELEGKRALVTGGSRGIGKVIATQLAAEGVDVVIAARTRGPLEEAAKAIAATTRRRIVPLTVDTGRKDAVDALIEDARRELGGIDILVNNAAIPGGVSPAASLAEVVDEHALEDLNVKVLGYLRTARALAPHLVAQKWGRIINIGGLAAYKTGRTVATLRNIGVGALTKSLADELGPHGINVNAIHPGATRTEKTNPASEKTLAASVSIGRIVDAKEIAYLVAFLASPRSVALNGESISAGGGSLGPIRY